MFWTEARTRRITNSALISIALSVVIVLLGGKASQSLLFRGDFPAFYVAANLAAQNQTDEIYQPSIQHQLQAKHWPELEGRYFAFSYPPFVAQLLSPLGKTGPREAKIVYSLCMFIFLGLSILVLRPSLPCFHGNVLPALAGWITFTPAFVGLFGGQNSALSTLLMSIALWGLSRERASSQAIAGLALGIWLFKPQFALFFILGATLFANRVFLLGVVLPAIGYYLISASTLGAGWPLWWFEQLKQFGREDNLVNGFQMISLWRVWELAVGVFANSFALQLVVHFLFAGLAFWMLWQSLRLCRLSETVAEKRCALFMLSTVALMLSPHTLFYELTWLVPAILYYNPPTSDRNVWLLLTASLCAGILVLTKEMFFLNPLVLAPLIVFFQARAAGRRELQTKV